MADPAGCLAHTFPFQHAHAPKKERDGHRTENRLIQVYLEGGDGSRSDLYALRSPATYPIDQRFGRRVEL